MLQDEVMENFSQGSQENDNWKSGDAFSGEHLPVTSVANMLFCGITQVFQTYAALASNLQIVR